MMPVPVDRKPQRKILALATNGNIASIAPILEICRILHTRGHIIEFATRVGLEDIDSRYPFISCVHNIGQTITPDESELYTECWTRHESSSSAATSESLRDSVEPLNYLWTKTQEKMKLLAAEVRPDFILADWQDERAVGSLSGERIPVAVMWAQKAWAWVELPATQQQVLMKGLATLRRLTGDTSYTATPEQSLKDLVKWRTNVHRNSDGESTSIRPMTPNYISFINSFPGLCSQRAMSPLLELVGPILEDAFPPLSHELGTFLDTHHSVLYITLGTHAQFSVFETQQIVQGVTDALEKQHIDGVIWATRSLLRENFFDVFEDLLNNKNPQWKFLAFAPQRAILAHPSTRLFFSQCGSSSLNEAVYHGVPVLAIDRDHPFNSKQAESAGIAIALSHGDIQAMELCRIIGGIVLDVYSAVQRNVEYMQNVAVDNSSRKELAANIIEKVLFGRK